MISNPGNRFESTFVELDLSAIAEDEEGPPAKARFYEDASESIVTYNSSPDLPFGASINPYRGCEHGCSYCYARPFHEYLGFSAGLDFETKIVVKPRAAALLRKELSSPKWKPQWLALSGVTDPYQPVERRLGLSRACLETLLEFRNPVGIVTKNRLITRDIDILAEMAKRQLCHVSFSINSLDAELARRMEPRTSSPTGRLQAASELSKAGVPVGVFVAPVIPGLNDHEIPAILNAAASAGASYATFILLRLPHGMKNLFFEWLETAYPGKRDKIESRLRELRGGELNRSAFGERFRGTGAYAEQLSQLFHVTAKRCGFSAEGPELSVSAFRRPGPEQMSLGL